MPNGVNTVIVPVTVNTGGNGGEDQASALGGKLKEPVTNLMMSIIYPRAEAWRSAEQVVKNHNSNGLHTLVNQDG